MATGGRLGLTENGGWANVGKAVTRIVIAGTVSEATGGKFENGAAYAAFAVAVEAANLKPNSYDISAPTPDIDVGGTFDGGQNIESPLVEKPDDPGYTPRLSGPPEVLRLEEVQVWAYAPVCYDFSAAIANYYSAYAARKISNQLQADYAKAAADRHSWMRFKEAADMVAVASGGALIGGGAGAIWNSSSTPVKQYILHKMIDWGATFTEVPNSGASLTRGGTPTDLDMMRIPPSYSVPK